MRYAGCRSQDALSAVAELTPGWTFLLTCLYCTPGVFYGLELPTEQYKPDLWIITSIVDTAAASSGGGDVKSLSIYFSPLRTPAG
jgi:hypothetical protein